MSSSPRLIVLLIGAFVFLGAFPLRAQGAILTLSSDLSLPGLTFESPLTFHTQTPISLSFDLDESQSFTISMTTSAPIEEMVIPTPETITEPAIIPSPTPTATSTPSPTPTEAPTPTPTTAPLPTPTPAPVLTSSDLENLFSKYAGQYSVDKEMLKRIAQCESGFNAAASYLDYGGMFQFSPSSWSVTRTAMNQDPNPDLRFNAEESIKTAAFKISINGPSAWPSCH